MAVAPRHPIVAVMGHIDHGKSSLLDYIRKANVTATEAGGITQHVSAYVAEHEHEGKLRRITFLDTPGHEAFKALRARGAAAADIAILVIAADEGVKPQTAEAFSEITEAGIPFVVAFTKVDKNGADVEKAKISALEAGIYLEGLGGNIPFAGVSSKSGQGIPELLDLVLLTADLAELTADVTLPASGFVLESSQDPKRGISATLIIKNGTLTTGAFVVAGQAYAPVRFIEDFQGKRTPSAGPSEPVSVSGWNTLPTAGQEFTTVASKKEAEKLASDGAAKPLPTRTASEENGKVILPVVLKADVTGSIEAIANLIGRMTHERVAIKLISTGVGSVTEGDVKTAQTGGGMVIAFHVSVDALAGDLALRANVPIESFTIIYELEERVKTLLIERAPRIKTEEVVGTMKVLKAFSTAGAKQVLGARYLSGAFSVSDRVKIMRRGIELATGKILNLQVARADVQEIHVEGEFGLQVETKTEIAPGDELHAFRVVES
ncbi:MAG TPA: translation initiation factor IF-2 [Candidatus Paceibacterota bacterium]|nr:translation initiation factor IF-2 [Candidatus Paceibacterota bacterium]